MEHVLIIGGGCSGGALAHDLTLRGFRVTLVEKGSLLSGTSGRHHGLLHSGARYALHDVATARECYRENQILRHLAPQAIEPNDGLFVALDDDDMGYLKRFMQSCRSAGIPVREIGIAEALALEPALDPHIKAAVQVPDAAMDTWRLPLHFFATARANGASILTFNQVIGLVRSHDGVRGVTVHDMRTGEIRTLSADMVVNAAGPWAGKVAALSGVEVPVRPGPGVMVAVSGRYANMVINRLHPAGEGDILVAQRNQTIIGTTIWLTDDPDGVRVPTDQAERLVAMGARLIPSLARASVRAIWSASRPLLHSSDMNNPMRTSRGFVCIDHEQQDGVAGMVSLVGGKATTLRAMAQEAADLICRKTGRAVDCTTAEVPLLPYRSIMQDSHEWI